MSTHFTVAQVVYAHHVEEQDHRSLEFFQDRSTAVMFLLDLVNHEPHVWPEGFCRDDNTGEIFYKYAATLDDGDAVSPCCGMAVYVVGPGAFRCSQCGDLVLAYEMVEPDPTDPPTQDKLYELTHDMTAEFVELHQHARDCNCPACNGELDRIADVLEEIDDANQLDFSVKLWNITDK